MKKIELTQGYEAIVDDDDFERINKYKWCAQCSFNNIVAKRKDGGKRIFMHREILNIDEYYHKDKIVIHINGNGLDNRKENIKIGNKEYVCYNRRLNKNNSSGYKGVYRDNKRKKWAAAIGVNKKVKWLGYFNNRDDAAMAYNSAAIKYFGEFANLNKIEIK